MSALEQDIVAAWSFESPSLGDASNSETKLFKAEPEELVNFSNDSL
jgi:hypothetical protein